MPAGRQFAQRYRPAHFPLLWTQTHRRAELAFGLRPPGSHRVVFFDGAFGRSARVCLGAIVFEHEKAQHRRQIGMLTRFVDRGDEIKHRDIAPRGDFLERIPECIFKAYAGRLPVYFYRSLDIIRIFRDLFRFMRSTSCPP